MWLTLKYPLTFGCRVFYLPTLATHAPSFPFIHRVPVYCCFWRTILFSWRISLYSMAAISILIYYKVLLLMLLFCIYTSHSKRHFGIRPKLDFCDVKWQWLLRAYLKVTCSEDNPVCLRNYYSKSSKEKQRGLSPMSDFLRSYPGMLVYESFS